MFKGIRRWFHKTFGTCTWGTPIKTFDFVPVEHANIRYCTHELCNKTCTKTADLDTIAKYKEAQRIELEKSRVSKAASEKQPETVAVDKAARRAKRALKRSKS
ncbi:hypothetical protein HOT95_gp074 [Vibrio phage vB_VpS_PG07]|uniref:Uncharacterized protein n=1 Tax=Vibrio phage vB_VpS_PG07 TaxID=2301664 RepID=A0A385E7K5_9CAUD|nr:hypothetical protein HOT95_gp074 [Vibrio phage vB_VpS_PG07]AXQ66699.1 hypothetical protein [Vibrio phage vB_VpS_PG07]